VALAGEELTVAATGDGLKATKAWAAGVWAAVVGFVAPGVTYLLTVDQDGISGREWQHALLIAVAFAAGAGTSTGGLTYAVENKRKSEEIDPLI
jgi:hypothetical protein